MSRTAMRPSRAAMPSVVIVKQNGHETANVRAPVPRASATAALSYSFVGTVVEPHSSATGAATGGLTSVTRHFNDSLRPRYLGEQCSGSGGDVLHARQVTWVVVSNAGGLPSGCG